MQLPGFDVNITGKDIVKNNVFHKVGTVKFFIIALFNLLQRNGNDAGIVTADFVRTVHKYGIFGVIAVTERLIGAGIHANLRTVENTGGNDTLAHLAD